MADKQILLLFPLRMQERDGRDRRLGISGTASLGGCAGARLCRVTRRHLRVFYWKSKGADCLGRSMETIRMRKMREVRWTWEGGRMCLACPWTRWRFCLAFTWKGEYCKIVCCAPSWEVIEFRNGVEKQLRNRLIEPRSLVR